MRQIRIRYAIAVFALTSGCVTPNPHQRHCTEKQPLQCEDATLLTCNENGTGEVSQTCPLGCSSSEPRCSDPIPSNGLARDLEFSKSRANLDLGDSATINTDTGEVTVADAAVTVDTDVIAQTGAPNIRVLVVGSLTAKDVVVSGKNALAIVSNSDIAISGTFTVSAKGAVPGPGALNEDGCKGQPPLPGKKGGSGGGGFGSSGGAGGVGIGEGAMAGMGGGKTGTASLIPLRGGCDGGAADAGRVPGAGGGAIQLLSRNQIVISGIVAANGGGTTAGGGSGGGILLEAPSVEISGTVVANGGSGGSSGSNFGCAPGQDGRTDAMPAPGGVGCTSGGTIFIIFGGGGSGAAGDSEAQPGGGSLIAASGHGGGGVGRIRINTAPGGLTSTGVVSPNFSLGTLTGS